MTRPVLDTIANKKNSIMNKPLREMLIGVLLGDAHIGRTGLDKAFITFEQSKKN
jgi:hypothetical protein